MILLFFSITGRYEKSSADFTRILNLAFSQVILAFISSFTSINTSLSGSFLTISEKIFASIAILPASIISPNTFVSIPSSISLAVILISPSVASIKIHSNIDMVVLDDTAFITILIPDIKSDFLQTNFISTLLHLENLAINI